MKDDRVYLRHILRCISRIEEYTVGGRESFFELVHRAIDQNVPRLRFACETILGELEKPQE